LSLHIWVFSWYIDAVSKSRVISQREADCPFPSLHCCCKMNTTNAMQREIA